MGKHKVETFCPQCGANVRLVYVVTDPAGSIAAAESCAVTDGGTVYRQCHGCGEDVAHVPASARAA